MRICLFGAGSRNIDKDFLEVGYSLGVEIAKHGHCLVFGGGAEGLMGAVARGVYDNDGEIISIYPELMSDFEDLFEDYSKLIITSGMDDRKKNFLKYSDCVLVTPGGIGTLDEFFEVLTLKKLRLHEKPIIIFNYNHFFDKMLDMLNEMIDEGFVDSTNNDLFVVTTTVQETLEYFF